MIIKTSKETRDAFSFFLLPLLLSFCDLNNVASLKMQMNRRWNYVKPTIYTSPSLSPTPPFLVLVFPSWDRQPLNR